MTQFSVIIPTYNRCDYLSECLKSVFAQTLCAHEVIVVDDGSTDGTLALVESYGDRLRVIRQANAGPGAARNAGAAVATGDYLAFLDSDDVWLPWALDTFAHAIETGGSPSLLVANLVDCQRPRPLQVKKSPLKLRSYPDYLASSKEACLTGAGLMAVKRAKFIAADGFLNDRMNAEDHDLALRLGTDSGFVHIDDPVMLLRRVHAGGETYDEGKTVAGVMRLVARERSGVYPGGTERRVERRRIITRHARAAIFAGAKTGRFCRAAVRLYSQTLSWNLRLGRIAFLGAAPLILVRGKLGKCPHD